jgi:hypothetical protein
MSTTDSSKSNFLYAGLSGISVPQDHFDLGHGVSLKSTFAHIFSAPMVAFSPAEPGKAHKGPWRAARGGYGFDVHVEMCIPLGSKLPGKLSPEDTVILLAALIRLAAHPYMLVSVLADGPLEAEAHEHLSSIRPFETTNRLFRSVNSGLPILDLSFLNWLANSWAEGAELFSKNKNFRLALLAFDSCAVHGKTSLSLLLVWGALEQLFITSRGELRYRVASNIASYIEPMGEARLCTYKKILKLYDQRSIAAHSAKDVPVEPLVETFVIARNALMKIVEAKDVPSQEDLEKLIFGVS